MVPGHEPMVDRKAISITEVVTPSSEEVELSFTLSSDTITTDETVCVESKFRWTGNEDCTIWYNDNFPINHPLESDPQRTPGIVLLEPNKYEQVSAGVWVPDKYSGGHSLAPNLLPAQVGDTFENEAEVWQSPRFAEDGQLSTGEYIFTDSFHIEAGDGERETYRWQFVLTIEQNYQNI